MISKDKIDSILSDYKKPCIATFCSHTALQIFHGARQEGIRTIGICTPEKRALYDSFTLARPDEYVTVQSAPDMKKVVDRLVEKNAIVVPHGSFVEYVGEAVDDLQIPFFGNRKSLYFERSRQRMFSWLKSAGIRMPQTLSPDKIDRPCIVKFPGAKGGRGYLLVKTPDEFYSRVKNPQGVLVQEYLIGVRTYPHYFHSKISKDGYHAGNGIVELMGMDQRMESNVEECYREVAMGVDVKPTFTVIGNREMVIRESLLSEIMEMGKRAVESADRLFGGMPGPFCIECIVDENLNFHAFEISARIVAGTNIYPMGSPYSFYRYTEPMSMGRRIAREIKSAAKKKMLQKTCY
jgi:5-formaminoimidazole-4-carboxamide-1-(beta)-D-ribofuranosyl 5'-monophosphate synthetase